MRSWRRVLAAIIIALVAAAVIWGFFAGRSEHAREAEQEQPIAAPQRVSTINGEVAVALDAAAQRASGIETAERRTVTRQEQVRAYGTVLDLQQLTDLSNSYVAALSARRTAQAKLTASKPAFERAEALYRDRAASAAQVQAAEAAFHIDEAGVAAAGSQLRTLATTAQQAWGSTLAQALVDRTPMFARLMERRDVLLQVTLPPGVFVAKQPASAFVELADGSRAALQLVSPATKTDPRIQGVSFFYTAVAETGLLPGMSVLVFVPSDAGLDGVLVPASSIVWWQGRAWAYVRIGADRFARREVATDQPTAEGGYVARQLAAGGEVVTQGAQMLLSEELRGQVRAGEGQ